MGLGKLFGFGGDGPQGPEDPTLLQPGDFIEFGRKANRVVAGKRYSVLGIDSYELDGETVAEFRLMGEDGQMIVMAVEDEDGERYLALSRDMPLPDLERIVTEPNALHAVFEPGLGQMIELTEEPENLAGWLAPFYEKRDDAAHGVSYRGDQREPQKDGFGDSGESFDYYLLEHPDEGHALEVAVYDGGRMEIAAVLYMGLRHIASMQSGMMGHA
ncbi:MAG: hypothetical protein Alpg2KO_26220 [Alphaproteobacteria bacterium]